jgi:hypothetical protein
MPTKIAQLPYVGCLTGLVNRHSEPIDYDKQVSRKISCSVRALLCNVPLSCRWDLFLIEEDVAEVHILWHLGGERLIDVRPLDCLQTFSPFHLSNISSCRMYSIEKAQLDSVTPSDGRNRANPIG